MTVALAASTVTVPAAPFPPTRHVVLVTLDTTRADALGAWGGPPTPTLDRLAAAGTRYAAAVTPSPLTLPAHASLLTGRDPVVHGVRRNDGAPLADDVPTLAGTLARRGWATGAVVASLVLDRRHGLDRGFDQYDDRLLAEQAGQYGIPERDAGEVTDLALAWLAARDPARPWFLWVHYYDPHAPYQAAGANDAERYLGEIARVDGELARLTAALPDDHLLVVVGDHGEALGQRGERYHGLRLHSPTLHVPLLMEGRGVAAGRVVAQTVSTVRVAATILDLVGVGAGGFGEPLPWRDDPGSGRPVFSETLLPLDLYGWAPLAAVTDGGLRYVGGPQPRLYDLAEDSGEAHDLATERPAETARLAAELADWWHPPVAGDASAGVTDAATQRALAALGYAGAPATTAGDDIGPVEGMALLGRLEEADRLAAAGAPARAAEVLDQVLARNPSNPAAWAHLAVARVAAGDSRAAVTAARRASELRPGSVLLAMRLAETLRAAGEPDAAATAYRRATELDPRWAPAWTGLADLAADDDVERAVLHAAVAATDSVALLVRLARAEAAAEPPGDPEPWLARATALDPESPEPWRLRGELALAAGRAADGIVACSRAVQLDPTDAAATLCLGRAMAASGEVERARPTLRRAAVLGRGGEVEQQAGAALAELPDRDASPTPSPPSGEARLH